MIKRKSKLSDHMRKKLLGVIIVGVVVTVIAGVFYPELFFGRENNISITGSNIVQTVSSEEPITRLSVTGDGCQITVSSNTIVEEIVITGINTIVYIPQNTNPKITIEGSGSQVITY